MKPRGPSAPGRRPKPRGVRVGDLRPLSEPRARPARPGQVRPRRGTPLTLRAPARRERTRGFDQSADACGAQGGGAASHRGAGREGAGAREARVRPSRKLPQLPGAVRPGPAQPGPEAACGGSPGARPQAEAQTHLPAIVPFLGRVPAAASLAPCLTSWGRRDRGGNPKRELQPTTTHSSRCSASHSNPGKMARRLRLRPQRMCEGGRGVGRGQECFGPAPAARANRNPGSVLR